MGIAEETIESESAAKKWVIAGIQFLTPLKPIYTTREAGKPCEEDEEKKCCTTPTTPDSRIPAPAKCPAAPRKRKAASRSHCNGVREFFRPPELESVFVPCVERA